MASELILTLGRLIVSVVVLYAGATNNAEACEFTYDPSWDKSIVEILIHTEGDSSLHVWGTGFIVKTYDSASKQVLISNRHVLRDLDRLYLRCNMKTESGRKVDTVAVSFLQSVGCRLLVPSDASLDLAALTLQVKPAEWDCLIQPRSNVAVPDSVKRGMEIFFLGFPAGLSVPSKSVPVYRRGVVAMDEQLINGGDYLVDAMIIGGSSGSPVFNCDGKLLGVLRGSLEYYFSDSDKPEIIQGTKAIDAQLLTNTGFGVMIPISRLVKFMEEINSSWGIE